MKRVIASLMLGLGFATAAQAITYTGNPKLHFSIVDPNGDISSGSTVLEKVRVYKCGGGHVELVVNESIDPTEVWTSSTGLPDGSYCSARIYWDADITLSGSNTAGDLELKYTKASTLVVFDATSIPLEPMYPYIVDEGEPCGAAPDLEIEIY